jgi:teichuronic acid biosynthesis glycosyltransferase TuaC
VARNVVTLSRLYPSAAYPGWGPFVRDEVVELARRNTMSVIAPLPWHLRTSSDEARRVAAVPSVTTEDGIRVVRPRLPGIPVGGRILEPWLWALRLGPLLQFAYDEIQGDLIHAHFALPDGFAAAHYASRRRVPLVLTIWGSDVLVLGRQYVSRGLLKRTFDRTQAIIAVSDELAERAEQLGAQADRIRVIPGGVPYLPHEPRESIRARIGIPHGSICVLWVGRFVPVKQPLDVVQAFAQFAASNRMEACLVMIGDGPLREKVSEFIHRCGLQTVVHLLGHGEREEVWRWQCAADVLVNSSRSEGTPLAVLEALGAGTPVAGYPLSGVRGVVDAVAGGKLAADMTPRALAFAIADALASARDRNTLARDARERFAISRAARAIEDVYEAVS